MSVRRLGIADLPTANVIVSRFMGSSSRSDPWDFLADPYTVLLVAEEDGVVVGWLYGYELLRPDGRRMMLIQQIEVDVAARRRGHGRALVGAAVKLAAERGHVEVVAPGRPGDPAARAVFTGSGARQAQLRQLYCWRLGDDDSVASSR